MQLRERERPFRQLTSNIKDILKTLYKTHDFHRFTLQATSQSGRLMWHKGASICQIVTTIKLDLEHKVGQIVYLSPQLVELEPTFQEKKNLT